MAVQQIHNCHFMFIAFHIFNNFYRGIASSLTAISYCCSNLQEMPKARDNENPLPPVREMQAPALFGVQGKVVLVTGGGSGIGAMIAAGFCANGATVIVSSRKDTTPFCDELTARGPGKAYCLQADVGKPEVACYPLSSCCITPPRAAMAGRGPARGRGQTSRGQAACVGE